MADDVTVDNGTLTDYEVRATETAGGKQIQHMRLDLGSGSTESVSVGTVPVSGAVSVSGVALAANQLPDNHQVTVSNTVAVSGTVSVNEPVSVDDNGGSLTVDGTIAATQSGSWTVTANAGTNLDTSTLALESGGNLATLAGKDFATQTTLSALNTKVTACDTGAVVVSSSALPAGAATETTLAAINTKTPSLGQAAMAASQPVVIASNQSNVPVNMAQINGVTPTLNTGVRDAGTQRVTIATNDTLATVTTVGTVTNITNQGQLADNAAFVDGTTRVNMSGHIFDEVAGTALTENDAGASRMDSKRAQICTIEDETTRGRRTTVTAANALKVDGSAVTQPISGTVTVNQPVAVTDNSGSLTVDNAGTFATQAAQSGTWNINTVTAVTDITNPIKVQGKAAAGAALLDNPVPIAGRSLFGAAGVPFVNDIGGGITLLGVQLIDGSLNFVSFNSDGSLKATGNVLHDAVDTFGPIKTGGKAASYAPATSDQPSANKTAVAAADRTDGAFNLYGEAVEGVNSYFFTLDNISTTYNNTTTIATSTAKNCWNYRQASFSYELTRANSPTDILFEVEVSLDGTNYTVMQNDFLGDIRESTASIGASGIKKTLTFPIACQKIKVKATATGTTASATFTVANACLYLRN